ncbi:MAG: tol-pal system protein YbgF [Caulobacterales bacterium 68-7]|mgnify:FL=1|nr:tol-pal system protein YbgF [Caulobacterales bacterium]OJU09860.1 MAG: tol-pal system protein YbgF [Caulobacterales bacterium 68-7]
MKVRLLAASAFAAVLAMGTLATAVAPAFAQTPIIDDPLDDRSKRRLDNMEKVMRELRAVVFQGRDTGKPVVVQPAETDQLIFSLSQRIDDLEQSLRRSNGDNEVVTRDLAQTRNDLNASRQRADSLEQRLTVLEKKAADMEAAATAAATAGMPLSPGLPMAGPVNAPPGAPPPAVTNSADTFANARRLLNEGDTAGAEAGFADYVSRFGETPRAAEARYWLGKTLTARRAYADAADNYLAAVRGWPQTAWAPDALVELSRSLLSLGNTAGACQTLAELPRRYPKAPAAITGRAATTRNQAKCSA